MPLIGERILGWSFDYSWNGPEGEAYIDVLDALHHGAGPIATRIEGRDVIGQWNAEWELRQFARMAWPGENLSTDAFTAAHWAAGWAPAQAGQHAAYAVRRRRTTTSTEQHDVPIRSAGRILALIVNGQHQRSQRASLELNEEMAADWERAAAAVRRQLAEDLEERLLDMGKLKDVVIRCHHCGEAIRGHDRDEAKWKLEEHIRRVHGRWR